MARDVQTDALIRRRVLWNTVANYVGKGITLLTWFFLTPYILTHLGPSMYGLWVLVGSIAAYGSLLDLGLAGALIKYVAEYRAREQHERAGRLIDEAAVPAPAHAEDPGRPRCRRGRRGAAHG